MTDQSRRDGAADAVVLSLAHRLYRPMVTLSDAGRALGLTDVELQAAVRRFKARANQPREGAVIADVATAPPAPAPRRARGAAHPDTDRSAPPGMKRCRTCGKPKPLDQFNKDAKRRDGRAAVCRPCDNEYQRERKAIRKAEGR